MQCEGGFTRTWQVAHRACEFVHAHRASVQFNLVILIDTHNRVLEFTGAFFRRFGFRQINLHLRLVFLKRRRDDKKDQQDNENIDERDDNNQRRPPFSHCEVHVLKCAARFTRAASESVLVRWAALLPFQIRARSARNSIC